MTHPHVPDPWDAASNARPPTYTHFGQLTIHADNVIWPKGMQLRDCPPFDQKQHKTEDLVVRITMMATPLPGRQNPFPHERIVTHYSREWTMVSNPSIKELGLEPKELDGKFVKYRFKPARTYTAKDGTEKQSTSFEFLELYDTEAECIEAAEEFFASLPSAKTADEIADEIPGFEDDGKQADPNYATAVQFLPALWKSAQGDVEEMQKLLAGNPLTGKLFTISSPEVIEVIQANPT